jgi:sRNA-binding regulator protein Hfq
MSNNPDFMTNPHKNVTAYVAAGIPVEGFIVERKNDRVIMLKEDGTRVTIYKRHLISIVEDSNEAPSGGKSRQVKKNLGSVKVSVSP